MLLPEYTLWWEHSCIAGLNDLLVPTCLARMAHNLSRQDPHAKPVSPITGIATDPTTYATESDTWQTRTQQLLQQLLSTSHCFAGHICASAQSVRGYVNNNSMPPKHNMLLSACCPHITTAVTHTSLDTHQADRSQPARSSPTTSPSNSPPGSLL